MIRPDHSSPHHRPRPLRSATCLALLVVLLGCKGDGGGGSDGRGMAASGRQPCPWPDSLDAVVAAPGNHRVVLENERVRVLDVTVAPGEREPVHAHCLPSVMYLMYEGVYRDYGMDGELLSEATRAQPDSAFPMTLWLDPQGPHAVQNLDRRPVRLLRVELKP